MNFNLFNELIETCTNDLSSYYKHKITNGEWGVSCYVDMRDVSGAWTPLKNLADSYTIDRCIIKLQEERNRMVG